MKVCSKCNAHYQDDIFFCLQDGTPLEETDKVRVSKDSPNFTGEETQAFDSEETIVKSDELGEENKSEATVIRPNANDSEVTVIRSNENRSEDTIVRPKLIEVNLPNTQKVSRPDNKATPEIAFTSTESNSNHNLKIAALSSAAFFIAVAMCVALGVFDSPQNPTEKPVEGTLDTDFNASKVSDKPTPDLAKIPEDTAVDEDLATNTKSPEENLESESDNNEYPQEVIEETPVPTPKPVKQGKISGKLTYPSEGIPSDFHICVKEIKKNLTACSNSSKQNFKFNVNRATMNYSVIVPDGTYYIYAIVPGQGKAYYTQFIRCGMDFNCKSHKKIPIKVKNGETVGGITVGDWYDF